MTEDQMEDLRVAIEEWQVDEGVSDSDMIEALRKIIADYASR